VILDIDGEKKRIRINGQWHRPPKKQYCDEYCSKKYHAYLWVLNKWQGKIPAIDRLIQKQLLDQIARKPTEPMRKKLAQMIINRNRYRIQNAKILQSQKIRDGKMV